MGKANESRLKGRGPQPRGNAMIGEPEPDRRTREVESPDRSWSLEHLPWPEVGRVLARDPRLILPVGALVQHGPHLPLGTNTFIAERVAEEASQSAGRPSSPPRFHYGVRSPGKESFAGSAGLERKTLHRSHERASGGMGGPWHPGVSHPHRPPVRASSGRSPHGHDLLFRPPSW